MSLATDGLREILGLIDVYCVRAGVAIDPRWQPLMDDAYRCIREIDESDERLPCRCHHMNWEDE